MVAAMIRTSTRMVFVPPRRMNSRSCMTRRSLAWVSRPIEEISSKKIVPLSAASNRPCFSRDRPGEGALDVAEEVAFEQVGRERAAVDDDEREGGPVGVLVDGPGDELLARPALALDEDRAPGRGGGLDELEDLLHGLAPADDVAEAELPLELVPEPEVLLPEGLVLQGPLDRQQELLVLERLLDVVEGPDLHRLDGRFDRGVGGDDDDDGLGAGSS